MGWTRSTTALYCFALVAGSLFIEACNDEGENTGADADADSDADTDADGDTDADSDGDTDADGDSDADGDGDSDTSDTDLVLGDEACTGIEWGHGFVDEDTTSGFPVGAILPNWIQQGYVDRDGDGAAEPVNVRFDLCYLHKNRKTKSIFFILGDTT